ncbi:MAG: recombinase family protein [Candidatus Humimicrobiaceae bacterium]
MKIEESNIKYFLYARKSSESEDRQIQSIDDQVGRLKELASSLNLKIIDIFKEAKSAKNPGSRPIFEEMVKKIEDGLADGILTWQINRLSRNPVDSGKIQWLLQKSAIQSIQTIDRNYLPSDNVLLFSVESGMANQYILDLSKNVKRGLQSKLEKGWYPQLAPLGYLNDKSEHTIIKDPDRFSLIRNMWDLMLTGNYTPPRILKIANDEWGFRTRKYKRVGGNKLSRSCIYSIFNNPFYRGTIVCKGKDYQGSHEPVVSQEEFEIVQALLGKKAKAKKIKHDFAYTGLIRCGECGCLYTAQTNVKYIKSTGQIKKYNYYHCTRRKQDINCSQNKSIREDILDEMIDEELKKYNIMPEFRDWALEALSEMHKDEVSDRNEIYKSRQRAFEDIQKQIDNLIDMKIKGQINDEEYDSKRNLLLKDKAKIRIKLDETKDRTDNWLDITEKAFKFVTNLSETFNQGNSKTKMNILMALGKNITIIDGKLSIEPFEWLIPIKESYPKLEAEYLELKLSENENLSTEIDIFEPICKAWLGRKDSNQR